MADPTTDHPRDELLTAFRLGRLDEFLAATVARHLENCPQCRGRVGDTPSLASKTPSASATGPYLLPELGAHPHYQVIRELARGGMGVVYLVRNTLMDRFEVLKVLNKTLLARPGAAERFLREIRSAARLHHPNVVTAYAALPLGDAIAFAMEFVDGDDLSQMVKARGPLPVGHACAYTAQAALGLQHAHERDMVHRDIKPSNLILARMADGEVVKVLDFGLAKASSEGGDVSLTGTDDLMGTPDYIAPEQIQYAKQVDIRADIYSLGCTLYYLLAARPPFTEGTSYQRMTAHLTHRPDPVTKFRPDVPIGVVAILDKMMAKLPDERYSTPREVVAALGPFANVATEVRSPTLIEKLPTNQTDDIPNVRPHSAERTPTRIETGRTPTIIETPPDLEPATAHPGRLRRFWLFAKSLRGIFLLLCTVCFLLVEFSGFLNLLRNQGLFESTPEAKSFRSKRWEVVDVNRVEPSAFISSGWGGGYAWKQGSVWTFANHLKAGEVDEDGNYSSKLFSNNDAFEWHVVDGNLELKDYGDKTYSLQILERNDAAVTLAVRNNGVLTPEFVKLRATSQFNRWYRIFDHLIFHIYWLPAALGVLGAFFLSKRVKRSKLAAFFVAAFSTIILTEVFGLVPFGLYFLDESNRGFLWVLAPVAAAISFAAQGVVGGVIVGIIRVVRMGRIQSLSPEPSPQKRRKNRLPLAIGCGGIILFIFIVIAVAVFFADSDTAIISKTSPSARPASKEEIKVKPGDDGRLNKRIEIDLGDRVKLKMVRVPAGKFWMGGGKGIPGTRQEEVAEFYMGECELRQSEWKAVMGPDKNPSHSQGDDLPVESVSWNDAKQFIEELNKRVPAWAFRLPTEVEWEYACRGAATSLGECSFDYYFDKPANELGAGHANFASENLLRAGIAGVGRSTTLAVGTYKPNQLGLYDMHGNVSEWTDTLNGNVRVAKGGCWFDPASNCTAATSKNSTSEFSGVGLGFRVAANPAP